MEAMGAQVQRVAAVPYSDPNHYQRVARRVAGELPDGYWANQFDNVENRRAHFETTGPEIWEQTGGRIDAFVSASGTGGTLAGTSAYLKSKSAAVRTVLADPPGSALYEYIRNGVPKVTGSGSITEGIGIGRVTANMQDAPVDEALHVTDEEAVHWVYRLLREEGLFVSSTSGVNVAAAVRVAQALGPGHVVVTVLCDSGAKYLSRLFNRDWLTQKGLLEAAQSGAVA
jgi:cysteine synthase A